MPKNLSWPADWRTLLIDGNQFTKWKLTEIIVCYQYIGRLPQDGTAWFDIRR